MSDNIPRHVGLIMDGNGRWAKKRLLPRSMGHAAGMKRMIKLAAHAKERGINYLTVYALSTENLAARPQEELEGLFDLMRKYFAVNVKSLFKQGAAIRVIGDISVLPQDVKKLLSDAQTKSPANAPFTLVFAINYGSRPEIVRAARRAAEEGEITEQTLSAHLDTAGLPDPDLIIRTGGEMRLSNFLVYQAAYAELYFTKTLFPDFTSREFDRALSDFAGRDRRYGAATSAPKK